MFTSQVISTYSLLYVPSELKLGNTLYIPHRFCSRYIFWSATTILAAFFWTTVSEQRKFPYFKIHLNVQWGAPTWSSSKRIHLSCKWQTKRQISRIESCRCLPRDEYAQLKSSFCVALHICHYLSVWKDVFKGKIDKVSSHISLNKWTFVVDFDD